MTTIRAAEQKDVKELVKIGRLFFESTILKEFCDYDEITMDHLLSTYIMNENCMVFILEADSKIVGGIMAHITPVYWNWSVLAAQQLGWFVHPDYRGFHSLKLIEAYEQWAMDKGAKMIFSGAKTVQGSYEMMDKMLSRRGYATLESVHVKGVS